MNRHERRAAKKARRTRLGKLKVRCIGCDRVGQKMTKEHVWPNWLTERAQVRSEGVVWEEGKRIAPSSATIPLCKDCNHKLGSQLEGPVSQTFDDIESGRGLSDLQCELLIRWLWKFEGLFWNIAHHDNHHLSYSTRWPMIERVLGEHSLKDISNYISIGITLFSKNDEQYSDFPVGIDSEIGVFDSIFVSGVFSRTALMVFHNEFLNLVPNELSIYTLAAADAIDRSKKILFPPVAFETASDAIFSMRTASVQLRHAHEQLAQEQVRNTRFVARRPRVEIP